jgi:hypothetical protein
MSFLRNFYTRHPNIVMWIVLALGMVAMLVYSAKDVGLLPTQMAALIVSTILLAGLCVWIINWE